jgi:hypothetical protein
VARSRRFPHDDKVPILQVSGEMIRHEVRHDIVAVPESAAAVALQCEAQRKPKFVGIGRGQFGSVIDHVGRVDQPGERSKNTMP